ncbi:winged helix-turn-helix domain-containing protein [Clostridium sp. 001]|uniref:helix-turn-helix domain-containing protein n=1 Tax=Clostridium sp. 001 TaxID=1970093 RepID=UPI001C2C05B6|nr:winged helix-turn-helix domain-containing protein [Clostridium sp. 001]QXE17835.1 hypothetical protein B5S50_02660 [Clostridium sp. 001]QXE18432.1 hypothetical protein B5S50_06020 [Clostridium sp. 001]QXE18620.1 hypothetical protein B5S50_07105 [Clostridium sp. 001]QXE19375.1 hypothetical protein B5S50_11410 [Clostridium sp. 001]QXE21038.1 hypothetical protein B5S50_20500 [Clostridium sp. 001]
MGRKSFEIESLYDYKIEDLIELKNTTNSKFTRLVLAVVTMRYRGCSNRDIMIETGLSKVSIVKHIKNWNEVGIKAIKDHRGGSEAKLEPEIVDDLIDVVLKKSPIDFDFTCHTWTLALLALYVEKTYGVKVCNETIRSILISHNISYKRSQPKPTKADKDEQEAFKKNAKTARYFRVFI